jgi:hypothetical protein
MKNQLSLLIMVIKHLSHGNINKKEWDDFISQSDNGLIYAQSWYLDIVSPQWEALISDDLRFVMPVPIKKKYKIPYIVQPLLTQQLGIFSDKPISVEIIRQFIQNLPSYSYQLNLNAFNFFPDAETYPNYILSLDKTHVEIAKNYSKNTIRNIEKATKCNLSITDKISIEDFIAFYESVGKEFKQVAPGCLRSLIKNGLERGQMYIKGIVDKHDILIAALCYTEYNNRITYLLPVSNEAGKKTSAMFYLIDSIIRLNCAKDKLFDFEGSVIEGIARFYKGFGAENQPYYIIKNLRPSFLVGRI